MCVCVCVIRNPISIIDASLFLQLQTCLIYTYLSSFFNYKYITRASVCCIWFQINQKKNNNGVPTKSCYYYVMLHFLLNHHHNLGCTTTTRLRSHIGPARSATGEFLTVFRLCYRQRRTRPRPLLLVDGGYY